MKPMLIKGTPYKHQRDAYEFALKLFGLMDGALKRAGDANE